MTSPAPTPPERTPTPGSPDYDWSTFFDAVDNQPPRDTLLQALDRFDHEPARGLPRFAIDLGCGQGRDTLEMLRRGWRVLAIDWSREGLNRLIAKTPWPALWQLTTRQDTFEHSVLPPCDLVNASFAIPHCRPEDFPAIWTRIAAAIRPGGRFAGQLFGVNDGWAQRPDAITRTYHTRSEVESLLAVHGLIAEHLDEVQRDGKTAMGEPKYWHVFHVVARKS